MKKEFIICSALWVSHFKNYPNQPENIPYGYVVCGRRHSDCINTIEIISNKTIEKVFEDFNLQQDKIKENKGFLTSNNRFVGRLEAYDIALNADQILYGKESIDPSNQILISENLYYDTLS